LDVLRDLLGPGLIFLLLCFWLLRKVVKAARTESELEGERLQGSFAEELQRGRDNARAAQRPKLSAVPPPEDAMGETASPAPDAPRAPSPTAPRVAAGPAAFARSAPGPDAPDPRVVPVLSAPPPWLAPPAAAPAVLPALAGADVAAALDEHLAVVAAAVEEREAALLALTPHAVRRHIEVLWVRSASGHVAWCERRHPAIAEATLVREVICVARVQDGKAVERWNFG
jgi:hypothetical protein